MNIRRPSDWARMNNQEYLGHYRQDKYLDQGHNDIDDDSDIKEDSAHVAGAVMAHPKPKPSPSPDKMAKGIADFFRSDYGKKKPPSL